MADNAYTDLACHSPEVADAVAAYLCEQIQQQEELPGISYYTEGSTLRITYSNGEPSREWDMQLMGYRDGFEARSGDRNA
jgi:hypothetical protein